MQGLFVKLGHLVERWPALTLGLALLLLIGAVFGTQRLTFSSGIETFVSTKSPLYQDFKRYARDFGSDPVIVVLRGQALDDLIHSRNLEAMGELATKLEGRGDVFSILSPLTLIQESAPPGSTLSPDLVKAQLLNPGTGRIKAQFRPVLPDQRHALILISLKGDLSLEEMRHSADEVSHLVEGLSFQGVEVSLTGVPVLTSQIDDLIYSNLRRTLVLSVGLMLLVLAVFFSVRGIFLWRWLALGVMVLALAYAFGAMGWLNIPLTMATMAIFPILVGLDIDYGIQLHNRFDEEVRKGQPPPQAGRTAITYIGPAIGIALLGAACGISALFSSPLPLIKDFAKMLIMGLAIAYMAALFLVPTFLRWRRRTPARELVTGRKGCLESGRGKVGGWAIRNPLLIVPLALALALAGLVVDPRIGIETDETKWIRKDLPVIRGFQELQELTGGVAGLNILVEGDIANPQVLQWMLEVAETAQRAHPEAISKVTSLAHLIRQQAGTIPPSAEVVNQVIGQLPPSVKRNLVNADLDAANLVLTIKYMPLADLKALQDEIEDIVSSPPAGVRAVPTGWTVIQTSIWLALGQERQRMTLWSIGFVFLGLLILFRGRLWRAMVATFPMVLVVGWSALLLYLAGIKYNPLTATMGALILGLGAEYTILVLWRYHQERGQDRPPPQAMVEAISRLGRAILASGLTTIAGFGALLYARDFLILRDFSLIIMSDIFLALVGSLVVMPAVVVWVDSRLARRPKQG